MKKKLYKIKEKVWLWGHDADAPWHFVSITQRATAEIRKNFGTLSRGWQSLPVLVTVGKSSWHTSIFYDSRTKSYLLPLKAQIRKKEGVYAGDLINFSIKLLV